MPIVYVTDMARSLEFYERLGFRPKTAGDHWSELNAGEGAVLALHLTSDPLHAGNQVGLAVVSRVRLEHVLHDLRAAGVAVVREITDEAFGRSAVVADPDGLHIHIDEHDVDLWDDGLTVDGG